ncbi:replication protein A 32 kDa subunit B isoform X2 [Lathyrus oleraceus]|uniref:replication protein A 32 kDa subunit B isoform X2 n=1 Tax=Pisum sativum TaxID=3888 RepID=UPI001FC48066|nr:replication protein A 32 kDa subunit B-like isoform X2 [Pisum sativum]
MNASQFDGNAAFSGGGFMPQSTPVSDSPLTPSKNRDTQALLPLTIKQINDALQSCDDRANLTIVGVDVGTISLVGRICNKSEHVTDVKFVLDDGTGMIECTKWLQEPADSIQVESILPVTDFNEIAHHFIDCIYVHLYNSKLRASTPNQHHAPNSTQITPTKGYQPQVIPPNQFSGQHNDGQKSVEVSVLDVLHLPANRIKDEGTSVDVIAQLVGIPMDKLMYLFSLNRLTSHVQVILTPYLVLQAGH